MKKIVCVLLCVVLLLSLSAFLFGCNKIPREELLMIYMPGEYIDEDIFDDFSAWYEQETGKKITVQVKTFDAVENIPLAIGAKKDAYDLFCPSDYMVEYLINEGMIRKVDKTIIDVEEEGLFLKSYLDDAKIYDPQLEYAVPYMYGTLGLVYDYSKTNKHITSWESLFGNEFADNRSIKDSIRDAYAAACIYNARETLRGLEGATQKITIQGVFEDFTTGTVNKAQQTLSAVLESAVWDVDNVKFEMADKDNNSSPAIALMWSCDAGYVMNTYEDANGNEHDGNKNLWYVVPEEGGNVYIDNFVINKYAVNVEAANYFLKFLCQKDIAVKNSEYAGCISPVAAAYEELLTSYTEDEELYEDAAEGWKEMFLDMMFPSAATLNRCGVMRDYSSQEAKTRVVDMWGNIQ